jgi:hypothetical protein
MHCPAGFRRGSRRPGDDRRLARTQFLRPGVTFDAIGRELETLAVTPVYFRLFGLGIRGRDFTASDDLPGAEPVAIISERLWSLECGRNPALIGAVLPTKPVPIPVIGVAPPCFEGARRGERADMWIPSGLLPRVSVGKAEERNPLLIFARLGGGQTQASVERLIKEKHSTNDLSCPTCGSFRWRRSSGAARVRSWFEKGNRSRCRRPGPARAARRLRYVAALVLVHYERRRGESTVRLALGASRPRLTMELCRELLVIAVTGTVGAVVVAAWGLHIIPSLSLPGGVDLGRLDLSMDWRVLGAAVAMTVPTLLVSAAIPVNQFTRAVLARGLSAGSAPTASVTSNA